MHLGELVLPPFHLPNTQPTPYWMVGVFYGKGALDLGPKRQAEAKPGGGSVVGSCKPRAISGAFNISSYLFLSQTACAEVSGFQYKETALGDLDPFTSATNHGVRSGPPSFGKCLIVNDEAERCKHPQPALE